MRAISSRRASCASARAAAPARASRAAACASPASASLRFGLAAAPPRRRAHRRRRPARPRRRRSTPPVSASIWRSSASGASASRRASSSASAMRRAERGVARLGLGGAGAPIGLLLPGRLGALLVGADRARHGSPPRRGSRPSAAWARSAAARSSATSRLGRGGVGQGRGDALGLGQRALGVGEVGGGERGALAKAGAPELEPLHLDRRPHPPRARPRGSRRRLRLRRGGRRRRLRGRPRISASAVGGGALGRLDRGGGGGERGFDLGEAVDPDQPLGRRPRRCRARR